MMGLHIYLEQLNTETETATLQAKARYDATIFKAKRDYHKSLRAIRDREHNILYQLNVVPEDKSKFDRLFIDFDYPIVNPVMQDDLKKLTK